MYLLFTIILSCTSTYFQLAAKHLFPMQHNKHMLHMSLCVPDIDDSNILHIYTHDIVIT